MKNEVFQLRLAPVDRERLDRLAARAEASASAVLRRLVAEADEARWPSRAPKRGPRAKAPPARRGRA